MSSDDAVAVLADGRHEGERDAVDIGVLRGEEAVLVGFVGAAAQAAADDLLAQELGAERADAEDVGDGVGVPALGEHGDRHDAADRLAELADLADGSNCSESTRIVRGRAIGLPRSMLENSGSLPGTQTAW